MLTVSDAAEDLMSAVRAGADGYLLKDAEPEQLLERIREAAEGRTVFTECISGQVAAALHDEARRARGVPERPDLTSREMAVLRCVASGASNKLIGRELNIAEGTVKVHIKRLMKKLGFRSRVEAAIWATRHGLNDRS
jgi:two-component system nitrate/nitrite response regulator NarL